MEKRNLIVFALSVIVSLIVIGSVFYAVLKRRFTRKFYVFLFASVVVVFGLALYYLFTNRFGESRISLLTKILSSFGTGIVIILSLWGERIRQSLNPSKFSIEVVSGDGDITDDGGKGTGEIPAIYFHLRVVNQNPPSTITGCTVLLKRIRILTPGNRHEVDSRDLSSAPYCFMWAMTYHDGKDRMKYKNIYHEGVFDFVRFNMVEKKAMPVLVEYFSEFRSFFVDANKIVEYTLQIEGDNYKQERQQVFEVVWDGKWSDEPSKIVKDVKIKEVIVTPEIVGRKRTSRNKIIKGSPER